MPDPTPQTYATHVRKLPRAYLVAAAIIGLNVVVATALLVRHPGWLALWQVLLALGLFGIGWYARSNALVVQDRVIRLEERLRLERLLPDDLRARIDELTLDQIVSLRFASDAELAELTRQILDEGLTDRKEIKRRIRDWRGDHLRV